MKRYFYITPTDFDTAAQNNISAGAVRDRVYKYGWDIDRAIMQPVREKHDKKPWFPVCEQNNVKIKTFLRRVERGWQIEQAATTPTLSVQQKLEKAWSVNPNHQYKANRPVRN